MITKVSEQLYRGPRPADNKDLVTLRDVGVKTVIDLESGFYEEFHDDDYEEAEVSEYGLYRTGIHCSDVVPPKAWQVALFLRMVTGGLGPVYVHCLHGMDRTGFMVACYRMQIQGWSYKAARDEMFSFGFHKFPYLWWLPALKKFEVKK